LQILNRDGDKEEKRRTAALRISELFCEATVVNEGREEMFYWGNQ